MSLVTREPLGGSGSRVFEKVVTTIEVEAEKRVRNLSEIHESIHILKKISDTLS
jgi:hypothetical protein